MRFRMLRTAVAAALAGGFMLAPAAAQTDIPSYSAQTYDLTAAALQRYRAIAARGGWRALPSAVAGLKLGTSGPDVAALKARLALDGDLAAEAAGGDLYDAATEAAVRRFQARHGLSELGSIGKLTLRALNEPVDTRVMQLEHTLERLEGNGFIFTQRYVVVNIPGASVEAIGDGRVQARFKAVVGRPDRRSPILESKISAVNLNPTWTPPLSILKKDIMPKVAKDPSFLASVKMRVFNRAGQEIDPSTVDWTGRSGIDFWVREDPGPLNSLGFVRIDMPNEHAVYMHDTPKRELFKSDVRFHSSGCARVENVRDLATWILQGTAWTRAKIDATIATGEKTDIRLAKPIPVAWVYLTGWGAGDGTVQFRDDVYEYDTPAGLQVSTLGAMRADSAGFGFGASSKPTVRPSAWAMDEH
jgi:murein L,D-transpeptidase YcbB/YkuD